MQNHKLNKKFVQTRRNHHFKLSIKSRIIVSMAIFLSFGAIIPGMILLSSATASAATSTAKNDISVKVSGYCSVSNENHTYNKEIGTGSFSEIGSGNVFDIYCNDEEGYVVYAVGNGKDTGTGEATEGVTDLIGTDTNNKIATGTLTSGSISNWSFKLSNATSGMTIEDGFADNAPIPSTRTKVVSRPAGTAAASGDNFTATYSAYISTSQEPDTYTGGVKYILFHPSSVKPDGTKPSMQDFKCTLGSGETDEIIDSRDGTKYNIAKLADGKCWMTENLRIQNKTLDSTDSDIPSGSFTLPASVDRPNPSNLYDQSFVHVDGTYGGYYTWFAATAGEGTQSKSSGDVSHSICPKGWRLPTKDEFVALDIALGGTGQNGQSGSTQPNKYMGEPNNFKMGGYYYSGSAYHVGSYAWYWSSTADSSSNACYLGFYSSTVYPQSGVNKYYLMSVRCVSRE